MVGMTERGCTFPPWEARTFADGRLWGSVLWEVRELSQCIALLLEASGVCVQHLKPVFLSLQMYA